MSGLADRLSSPGPTGDDTPPDGWKARLDLDTEDGGYLVSKPYSPEMPPDYDEVISEFGEDPKRWRVQKIRRSRWQTYDERWLEAARIELVPRHTIEPDPVDIERLCEQIVKWRPRSNQGSKIQEGEFVQGAGDLQLGKPDGGGAEFITGLFLSETEKAVQRLRDGLKRGHIAEGVTLPWLGDCIEGIWSQGGSGRMGLDLTPTQQVRVYRRLMWSQVKSFSPHAEVLRIPVVPGNHDEPIREAGKQSTPADDSWAIEGASAVMMAVEQNPELAGRVEFRFPGEDEYTITLNVNGTLIGFCHGHQFGNGAKGWKSWWDGQSANRSRLIGEADMLMAAHHHHQKIEDYGDGRLLLQIPALDGGSGWYLGKYGDDSPSRMVSFWTKDGEAWGLDPLMVRPRAA